MSEREFFWPDDPRLPWNQPGHRRRKITHGAEVDTALALKTKAVPPKPKAESPSDPERWRTFLDATSLAFRVDFRYSEAIAIQWHKMQDRNASKASRNRV